MLQLTSALTGASSEVLKIVRPDETAGGTAFGNTAHGAIRIATSGGSRWSIGSTTQGSDSRVVYNTSNSFAHVFDHAGVELARITPAGNVGIGTANPSYKLSVGLTSDTSNYVQINSSDSSGEGGLLFTDSGGNSGSIRYAHSVDAMYFRTVNTERMRIDSAGNVGIGESSPVAQLHVKGAGDTSAMIQNTAGNVSQVYLKNTAAGGRDWGIRAWGSGSNGDFSIDDITAGGRRLTISSGGNVGIGTSSVSGKLHTVQSAGTTNIYAVGGLNIFSPSTATANQGITLDVTNLANGSNGMLITAPNAWTGNFLSGNHNGTQRFRVDHTGAAWFASTVTQNSDRRLKSDIAAIPDALRKLTEVSGVTYKWRDPARGSAAQMGVIAQEVEAVFPELVTESNGFKGVNYSGLIAPLIEAVKELKAANDNQAAQIQELRAEIDALKSAR